MLNKFCFSDDTFAQRERRQVEVLMFPTSLPPMFDMKVMAVQQTGVITVPFTANITAGSKTWSVAGTYRGTDSSNLKIVFEEKSLLESNRKVSKK